LLKKAKWPAYSIIQEISLRSTSSGDGGQYSSGKAQEGACLLQTARPALDQMKNITQYGDIANRLLEDNVPVLADRAKAALFPGGNEAILHSVLPALAAMTRGGP
jgi:hypothetical protein